MRGPGINPLTLGNSESECRLEEIAKITQEALMSLWKKFRWVGNRILTGIVDWDTDACYLDSSTLTSCIFQKLSKRQQIV